MKKIVLVIIAMFVFVPCISFADEAVLPGPATSAYDAAPLPPFKSSAHSKRASMDMGNPVNVFAKVLSENKKIRASQEAQKATDARIEENVGTLAKGMTELVTETTKNGSDINKVDQKVEGVKTQVETVGKQIDQEVRQESKNLGNQAVSNTQIICGSILLAVILLAVAISAATRRNRQIIRNGNAEVVEAVTSNGNRFVNRIDAVTSAVTGTAQVVNDTTNRRADEIVGLLTALDATVNKRADAVETEIKALPAEVSKNAEMLRPFVLKGIHGKNYRINPVTMEGKVRTLKLVTNFDEDEYDNDPKKFPRTPGKDLQHLISTNIRMLTAYFDPASKCTEIQKSVMAIAITSGEVEEV